MKKVAVNLDHSFEPQMTYVAPSRARSPNGLKEDTTGMKPREIALSSYLTIPSGSSIVC
jgi:hypothetical protein